MIPIIETSVFYEIAALLVIAAGIGLIGTALRQPLIVSYIAVGILVGPSLLGIARSDHFIDLMAELGIAVLLFLVGLKLDLSLVRRLGVVALTTGLGQVLFTSMIGFLICRGLGLDTVTSTYVAVALTFSSTIIIVKLLSDKKEIDSLHGRIALGFLIVQDLVVVLAMVVLSAIGVGGADGTGGGAALEILRVIVIGAGFVGAVLLFIRYVANPLTARLAQAPELLLCFAIGWAALLAALGDYLGFSKELGGLLAGVSLASTPLRETIGARMAALRDFLLLFFFIALGSRLDLSLLDAQVGPALLLSAFVLIGNPLIVLAIMGAMGYRKRTGFLAGLTVAQISEFSLIFIAMGVTLGHVTDAALGLVTLVGLITIALSTYMITYSHALYRMCEPVLGLFERRSARTGVEDAQPDAAAPADVLLFGLGRYGGAIADRLSAQGLKVLGVDFDPETLQAAQSRGFPVIYGDATDPEFVGHLPLAQARWAVAAMPPHHTGVAHDDPRQGLLQALRAQGFTGRIAVTTHTPAEVDGLRDAGADLILFPFADAADRAAERIVGGPVPSSTDAIRSDQFDQATGAVDDPPARVAIAE